MFATDVLAIANGCDKQSQTYVDTKQHCHYCAGFDVCAVEQHHERTARPNQPLQINGLVRKSSKERNTYMRRATMRSH